MKILIVLITNTLAFSALAIQAEYVSPNGLTEICRALPEIPGGKYSKKDAEEEAEYCAMDFYTTPTIALCPKTWSTSPGTMIYDISKSGMTQSEYEAQKACGGSKSGHDTITKYKQTMNQSGTSGTYSPSSLAYYHFSRYFDTTVEVPIAVFRSMDRQAHFDRVTRKAHENKMGKGEMIRKGWEWLYRAEKNPSVYTPMSDLFSDDQTQIYGTLVHGGGERYGAEINGVRKNSQYKEFQETPAFYALRENAELEAAIQKGIEKAQKSAVMKKAMGPEMSSFQMAVWMKELSEIVVLDYIFSQQDRVGNIDYKWYTYWVDGEGKAQSKKWEPESDNVNISRENMANLNYPKEKDGFPTFFVQRTRINDNDAGARHVYANQAEKFKMLEGFYHFSPEIYEKLKNLNADFKAQGVIYQYLVTELGLTQKDVARILKNTDAAFTIFNKQCSAGVLRFDLYGPKKILEGKNAPATVSCN